MEESEKAQKAQSELEKQLAATGEALDQAEAGHVSLQDEIDSIRVDLGAAKADEESAAAALEGTRSDLDAAREETRSTRDELRELRSDLQQSQGQGEEIQAELAGVKEDLASEREARKSQETDLGELRQLLDTTRGDFERALADAELARARREAFETEFSALEERLHTARAESDESRNGRDEARAERDEAKRLVDVARAERDEALGVAKEAQCSAEEAQRAAEEAQLATERAQTATEEALLAAPASAPSLEAVLEEVDRVRGDLFMQNTEVLNLSLDLEDARQRVHALEDQLDEARAQGGSTGFEDAEGQRIGELVRAYRRRRDGDRRRWSDVEAALGKAVQSAVGAMDQSPESRDAIEKVLRDVRGLLDRGRVESERLRGLADEEEQSLEALKRGE